MPWDTARCRCLSDDVSGDQGRKRARNRPATGTLGAQDFDTNSPNGAPAGRSRGGVVGPSADEPASLVVRQRVPGLRLCGGPGEDCAGDLAVRRQ